MNTRNSGDGETNSTGNILGLDKTSLRNIMVEFFSKFGGEKGLRNFSERGYISQEDLDAVLEMSVEQIIKELQSFNRPSTLCNLKHELGAIVDGVTLLPGKCNERFQNPYCGHPELNRVALYLVIGYQLVGWDMQGLDTYIGGALYTDSAAQKMGIGRMSTEDRTALRRSQIAFGNEGLKASKMLVQALEQKFVNN